MGTPALMRAQQLQDERWQEQDVPRQQAIQAHSLAIGGLRQKLSQIDPDKDPQAYNATVDQIQQNIHSMREILHPDMKLGAGDWLKQHTTDRLHITNHDARERQLQQRQQAGNTQDQQTAQALAQGSTYSNPFVDKYHQALGVPGTTPEEALQAAVPGLMPKTEQERFIRDYMKRNPKASEEDAIKAWTKDTTKESSSVGIPVKGTMVRSKQSPTGYAQTWVSRTDPNKIVAWQPISPSRWYIGFSTQSSTTDPFGVTSTTQHTMNPAETGYVDLSDAQQWPTGTDISPPSGSPSVSRTSPNPSSAAAAPKRGTKTAKASPASVAKPLTLDASGHIPESAGMNPMVRSAANQLLDGMDIDKLPLPQRDRQAAAAVASRYGWQQGTYTPKEKILINEAVAKLDQLGKSKALSVLDSTESRVKIGQVLAGAQERGGWLAPISRAATATLAGHLTPAEQQFIREYNAAVGVIAGLGPITRGNRATEASIHRLMIELPNVLQSGSAEDARQRIDQLLQEVTVATQTKGSTPLGGSKAIQIQRDAQGRIIGVQ